MHIHTYYTHVLYIYEYECECNRLRAARVENLAKFRSLLTEIPELTSKTRWSEVKLMVKDDERFLALEGDDKNRLEAFDDFMLALARKEAEDREMLKEKKRALEKEQRAAFAVFLAEMEEKQEIHALSQWRDLREGSSANTDQRFLDMLEQSKSKAQDMFEDFIEDLLSKYQKDRAALKDAYKAADKVDITTCGLVQPHRHVTHRRGHVTNRRPSTPHAPPSPLRRPKGLQGALASRAARAALVEARAN